MNYFGAIVSYIIVFVVFYRISKNQNNALTLLLATQWLRHNNYSEIPSFLSVTLLDTIALLAITVKYSKYFHIKEIYPIAKIFFIWCFFHIFVRFIQIFIYSDIDISVARADIIGVYLKIILLYLAVYGYLCTGNSKQSILIALFVNFIVYIGFTYFELFTSINFVQIMNTKLLNQSMAIHSEVSRYGLRLLHGPFGQWVATGTVFATTIALIIALRHWFSSLLWPMLFFVVLTIAIVGARAPLAAAIIVLIIFTIHELYTGRIIRNIIIASIIFSIVIFISKIDTFNFIVEYYSRSFFDTESNEAGNLVMRLTDTQYLIDAIGEIPIYGYAFYPRIANPYFILPIDQANMEVNIFFYIAFDYGLIASILTVIFFLSNITSDFMNRTTVGLANTIAWSALLICMMSNGVTFFSLFIIPTVFLSMTHFQFIRNNNVKYISGIIK